VDLDAREQKVESPLQMPALLASGRCRAILHQAALAALHRR